MTELEDRIRSALVHETTDAPSVDAIRNRFWSAPPSADAVPRATVSWRMPAVAAAAVTLTVLGSVALSGDLTNDDQDINSSSRTQHTAPPDDPPPFAYSEREILAASERVFAAARAGDVPSPNVGFAGGYNQWLVLEMRPADLKKANVEELETRFTEIAGVPVKIIEGADQPPQPAVPQRPSREGSGLRPLLVTSRDWDGSTVRLAPLSGRLSIDGRGCVTVDDMVVVWPRDYRLVMKDGRPAVSNGTGRATAQLGERVSLTGGYSELPIRDAVNGSTCQSHEHFSGLIAAQQDVVEE